MFNFFRKIRPGLLSERKFSKYLLYAIGEIILVVIGILIALQINNWNNERQIAKKEQYYLQKLRNSLAEDSIELNDLLKNIEFQNLRIDSTQQWLAKKEEISKNSKILPKLFFGTVNARIETTTFEDLKSTGNLSIIREKAIIDSLNQYYKWINFIEVGVEQSIRNYTHLNIGPYLMEHYSINFRTNPYVDETSENYTIRNSQIRNDLYIVNALDWRKILNGSIQMGYGKALRSNKYLHDMLSAQIKDQ